MCKAQERAYHLNAVSGLMNTAGLVESKAVTKVHYLLAIMEKALRLIKTDIASEEGESRKFGFLFFNENIFVVADGSCKEYPIIVHSGY